MQRLQLIRDCLLQALQILLRLLAPLQLQRYIRQARALFRLVVAQALAVIDELLLSYTQLLVGTDI